MYDQAKKNIRLVRLLPALALGGAMGLALVAPGCGGGATPESLCAKIVDCLGPDSNPSEEECIALFQEELDRSSDAGCGSEYEDYLTCLEEELNCVEPGQEIADFGCEEQGQARQACLLDD